MNPNHKPEKTKDFRWEVRNQGGTLDGTRKQTADKESERVEGIRVEHTDET
jgi:hypothetical protein